MIQTLDIVKRSELEHFKNVYKILYFCIDIFAICDIYVNITSRFSPVDGISRSILQKTELFYSIQHSAW